MIDIQTITTRLQEKEPGYWVSKDHSPVSYPADGMDFTFQLEEQSYWFIHRNRCITSLIRSYNPQGPFFDIGGGNGFVSLAIQKMGIETILVEPDPTGSRNARQRGIRPIISAAMDDAGFIPECMDSAGLFDVLEHIDQDLGFLKEIHSLIKPGGTLFITVPAYQSLWSMDDVSAGHFRRYDQGGLNRLLVEAGFSILFSSYFFVLLPVPIGLFRTLPSRLGWRGATRLDETSTRNEYVAGSDLVTRLFAFECGFLDRLVHLPFGASLLVAASRL